MSPPAASVNVDALRATVTRQAALVRELKQTGAPTHDVKAAVDVLKQLTVQLAIEEAEQGPETDCWRLVTGSSDGFVGGIRSVDDEDQACLQYNDAVFHAVPVNDQGIAADAEGVESPEGKRRKIAASATPVVH